MAKLTISLEADPSDILPLLLALLTQQRDESGRRPRPASPFSGGFRMRGPFTNPEDLLRDIRETLARETGEGEPEEGDTGFEGLEKVFVEAIEALRARATGDDTPPEGEPEGREEPQGFDPGDDPSFPPSEGN